MPDQTTAPVGDDVLSEGYRAGWAEAIRPIVELHSPKETADGLKCSACIAGYKPSTRSLALAAYPCATMRVIDSRDGMSPPAPVSTGTPAAEGEVLESAIQAGYAAIRGEAGLPTIDQPVRNWLVDAITAAAGVLTAHHEAELARAHMVPAQSIEELLVTATSYARNTYRAARLTTSDDDPAGEPLAAAVETALRVARDQYAPAALNARHAMERVESRRAGRTEGREQAARKIADRIRAELVCCDVYDRDAGTQRAGREHGICFWGEAGARIAESGGLGPDEEGYGIHARSTTAAPATPQTSEEPTNG